MGIPGTYNTAPIVSKLLSLVEFVVHLLQGWVSLGVGGQIVPDTVWGVLDQLDDVLPCATLVFKTVPCRQKLYLAMIPHAPRQKVPQSKLAQIVLGHANEARGRGKLLAGKSAGAGPVNGLRWHCVGVPEKPHV